VIFTTFVGMTTSGLFSLSQRDLRCPEKIWSAPAPLATIATDTLVSTSAVLPFMLIKVSAGDIVVPLYTECLNRCSDCVVSETRRIRYLVICRRARFHIFGFHGGFALRQKGCESAPHPSVVISGMTKVNQCPIKTSTKASTIFEDLSSLVQPLTTQFYILFRRPARRKSSKSGCWVWDAQMFNTGSLQRNWTILW